MVDAPTISEFSARFAALSDELGPANVRKVLQNASRLELPAGRNIIRDRMPVDSLYFILEGEADISVEESGRLIALGKVKAGEMLGEVSVLSGEMLASSTVASATPVRLLRLKHQAFEDLIHSDRKIAKVLLRHLVDMLAHRLRTSTSVASAPVQVSAAAAAPAPPPRPAPGGGRNWLSAFFGRS